MLDILLKQLCSFIVFHETVFCRSVSKRGARNPSPPQPSVAPLPPVPGWPPPPPRSRCPALGPARWPHGPAYRKQPRPPPLRLAGRGAGAGAPGTPPASCSALDVPPPLQHATPPGLLTTARPADSAAPPETAPRSPLKFLQLNYFGQREKGNLFVIRNC